MKAHGNADSQPSSLGRSTESSLGSLQSSSRSSHYGAWGRNGGWGSRRSSWNSLARGHSLKHKPPSAEHESLLSEERHKALEGEREGLVRVHHHRRTLSLDTKGSSDLAELAPSAPPSHRALRKAGHGEHQDCNGKMPNIAKDIFPEMNNRKEHGEDEEEIDYVSTFFAFTNSSLRLCRQTHS